MLHAATDSNARTPHLPQLNAEEVAARFAETTRLWHLCEDTPAASDLLLQLHQANFQLWHLEDRARDPHATDSVIAEVKRSIDRTNQRRNDLVERLDDSLLAALAEHSLPADDVPLHSETPGMILDRLSILSLKIFHTAEETERTDASEEHRQKNHARLEVLRRQRTALTGCLRDLWSETLQGKRRFSLYRQMKMYNDPDLNPVLYRATKDSA